MPTKHLSRAKEYRATAEKNRKGDLLEDRTRYIVKLNDFRQAED